MKGKTSIVHDNMLVHYSCVENKINEQFKQLNDNNLINEDYNLYNGIEKDTEFIMKCVIDLLTKVDINGASGEYDYMPNILKGVNKVKINIKCLNGIDRVASSTVHNNILIIDISYNLFLRSMNSTSTPNEFKEYLFDVIEGTLYHELTHGKIDSELEFKGIHNDNDFSWYYAAEKYINEHSGEIDNNLYKFCYCIYHTYYQEIQAYAAEVTYEIGVRIKNNDSWNTFSDTMKSELLDEYLKNNSRYYIYCVIRYKYLPLIQQFDDKTKQEIFEYFNNDKIYPYKMNGKTYSHFLKQIKYGSERALYKMKRGLKKYKKEFNIPY